MRRSGLLSGQSVTCVTALAILRILQETCYNYETRILVLTNKISEVKDIFLILQNKHYMIIYYGLYNWTMCKIVI